MRNVTRTVLGPFLALFFVLSSPQWLASQNASTKKPDDKTAKPPVKVAAKKVTPAPVKPACPVETIVLKVQTKGAVAVARLLEIVFPDFTVSVPDASKGNTLLVADEKATPKDCKKQGWSTKLPKADLDEVWKELDQESVPAATVDPKYLIHLPNLKADGSMKNLPYPTPFLQLMKINGEYLLPIAVQGGRANALSDDGLQQQAARVKHDLEALDAQYFLIKDGKTAPALLQKVNGAADDRAKAMELAAWMSGHTITFSILEPRDVILAFQGELGGKNSAFLPLVAQHAVVILPKDAPTIGVWPAAEALERNVLLASATRAQQELAAGGAAAAKSTQANPAPADPAPAAPADAAVQKKAAAAGGAKPPAATAAAATTAKDAKPAAAADTTGGDNSNANQDQSQAPAKKDAAVAPANATKNDDPPVQIRLVRLYHMREASTIADAINKMVGQNTPLVAALDSDQLLILPAAYGPPNRADEIRHTIAMLDLPRPQVALQVWSYQISSKVKDEDRQAQDIQDGFKNFRDNVSFANDALAAALARGMGAVEAQAMSAGYFDQTFKQYLTSPYAECVAADHYCLGYRNALLVPASNKQEPSANPSLARFLLLLAAADDSRIGEAITAMKDGMTNGVPPGLMFKRFFGRVKFLSQPANLHISRAAILDFFFQYKMATEFPDDFSTYGLQQAAHTLDNILSPLMDAFNQDVDEYVECVLRVVNGCGSKPANPDKGTLSTLFGEVQVTTISGRQAVVSGKVNNYFDITQPPTLSDLLSNVSSSGKTGTLAGTLQGILKPKEIEIADLIANANTQPKVYAQVAKDASLTITPTSLDDASAAELNLEFDVKDETEPTTVNQDKKTNDLLDRVSEHQVKDQVRVESLKLFQISAFTMQLTHKSQPKCWAYSPFCVVWKAVFGSVPGLDNLFEITPRPQTKDNKSAAVVRAVVVPTAMDLGLSVRFENDRINDPVTQLAIPAKSVSDFTGNIFLFHKELMTCLVTEGNPQPSVPTCLNKDRQRLSKLYEDSPRQ